MRPSRTNPFARMRNAIILGKMLGSINPDLLQCFAAAADETLGLLPEAGHRAAGTFSLLSQFRHKELRRSIALINRFLETLGNSDQIARQLQTERRTLHESSWRK